MTLIIRNQFLMSIRLYSFFGTISYTFSKGKGNFLMKRQRVNTFICLQIVTIFLCSMTIHSCSSSNCTIPEDSMPPGYSIGGKEVNENFMQNRYKVQGSIPYFLHKHTGEPDQLINDIVDNFIHQEKTKWEKSMDENLQQDEFLYNPMLWIEFETLYLSKEHASIRMFFSIDLGGAHPNQYSKSLTIDLEKKTQMSIQDLFLTQSNYLITLSKIVQKKLPKILEENNIYLDPLWVQQGTDPVMENYQNICIIPEGLLITFDPYQVASYGDGIQSIEIPFSELRNVLALKPNPFANPSQSSTSHIRMPSVSTTIVPSLCVVKTRLFTFCNL